VEDVVVAAGAEAFGVNIDFSFASFACGDFWLPFEFFITCVTKAFSVMFFFFFAVDADFCCHREKRRSYIKNFVQTGYFRSFFNGRTAYNVYYANL
jgi:hypothetical protein